MKIRHSTFLFIFCLVFSCYALTIYLVLVHPVSDPETADFMRFYPVRSMFIYLTCLYAVFLGLNVWGSWMFWKNCRKRIPSP